METTSRPLELSEKRFMKALSAALKIIKQWGASREQACGILQISCDIYDADKILPAAPQVELAQDQLHRISLVLNIHGALRIIFDNPKNIYGFMGMVNRNEYFDGRTPLDIISKGDLESLVETFRKLDILVNV